MRTSINTVRISGPIDTDKQTNTMKHIESYNTIMPTKGATCGRQSVLHTVNTRGTDLE